MNPRSSVPHFLVHHRFNFLIQIKPLIFVLLHRCSQQCVAHFKLRHLVIHSPFTHAVLLVPLFQGLWHRYQCHSLPFSAFEAVELLEKAHLFVAQSRVFYGHVLVQPLA